MYFLSLIDDPQLRLVFFIIFGCCFVPIFILVMICFFKLLFKHHKRIANSKKQKTSSTNYLTYFGGDQNIISVSKNLSRVTIEVKDLELVNLEGLKECGIGVMVTGNTIKCSSQSFADQIE